MQSSVGHSTHSLASDEQSTHFPAFPQPDREQEPLGGNLTAVQPGSPPSPLIPSLFVRPSPTSLDADTASQAEDGLNSSVKTTSRPLRNPASFHNTGSPQRRRLTHAEDLANRRRSAPPLTRQTSLTPSIHKSPPQDTSVLWFSNFGNKSSERETGSYSAPSPSMEDTLKKNKSTQTNPELSVPEPNQLAPSRASEFSADAPPDRREPRHHDFPIPRFVRRLLSESSTPSFADRPGRRQRVQRKLRLLCCITSCFNARHSESSSDRTVRNRRSPNRMRRVQFAIRRFLWQINASEASDESDNLVRRVLRRRRQNRSNIQRIASADE